MKAIFILVISLVITFGITAQEQIRIATYNIKFLNKDINNSRQDKLKEVIRHLDADIIGLQEIDDRDALEKIFSQDNWHIIIDDDSNSNQDLAIVAKKDKFIIHGFADNELNANDEYFLFPDYNGKNGEIDHPRPE